MFVQDAITLLQSSLEDKQDTFGDLSAQVADTLKLIGNCYLSNGDADRALQALKKVHFVPLEFSENSIVDSVTCSSFFLILVYNHSIHPYLIFPVCGKPPR